MKSLRSKIKVLVGEQNSIDEVNRINGDIVKEAVTKMKPDKLDVSGGFTSDCFLHAPDILFDLLALIFKSWMVHGEVTSSVLVCAFIPLLKSQLKDPTLPDSYRAIASSSLVLQVFE